MLHHKASDSDLVAVRQDFNSFWQSQGTPNSNTTNSVSTEGHVINPVFVVSGAVQSIPSSKPVDKPSTSSGFLKKRTVCETSCPSLKLMRRDRATVMNISVGEDQGGALSLTALHHEAGGCLVHDANMDVVEDGDHRSVRNFAAGQNPGETRRGRPNRSN